MHEEENVIANFKNDDSQISEKLDVAGGYADRSTGLSLGQRTAVVA